MEKKVCLVLFICFHSMESVFSTGIIFNTLKKGVQHTKCKLHQLGSKIIQHDHKYGDPCQQYNEDDNIQKNEVDFNSGYVDQHLYLNGHSYGDRFMNQQSHGQESPEVHGQDNHDNLYTEPSRNEQNINTYQNKSNSPDITRATESPNENLIVDIVDNDISNVNSVSSKNEPAQTSTKYFSITEIGTNGKDRNVEFSGVDNSINDGNGEYKATTPSITDFPTNLDIDIRLGLAKPVPVDGGKNLGSVPCKDGKKATKNGCLEAL